MQGPPDSGQLSSGQLPANQPSSSQPTRWSRRQILPLAAGALGLGLGGLLLPRSGGVGRQPPAGQRHPPLSPAGEGDRPLPFDPMAVLREFHTGTVRREDGRIVREFDLTADTTLLPLNPAVTFKAWALNGRVPGPTLRANAGDRLRIVFRNQDSTSHSLHFHGIHPAAMDGIRPVRHGRSTVYEFDAEPHGIHPYHCHVAPVTRHVSKGLYGLLIVDPVTPRPPADELVLVMGGYDLKGQGRNDLYAFNGIPNYYRDHPIDLYQDALIRLYVLNMVEWDGPLTFHLHANIFKVYRSGLSSTPDELSDVITMGMAERHILEFSYRYPGLYMFHPHQDQIAERGCMGHFNVVPRPING
ncbi:multicopper oxidase domain-containing protein [Synechococcus sp. CBW1006]|uniref:multicopper oxidase domain-containing protein n=1 Tax=Synechococcus sp. CBW1006 TaxID=1353138 RepID=UPI0018CCD39C|nr:multicopper oxidase domain-containing protein [Synechococcus sp. CBW1006]QPN66605.1 multicopper oxidase domain-containing protein [Synechococcus sp. CBW1006]